MTVAKQAGRAKRKREDADNGSQGATAQVLWRVNIEEFNCRLRYNPFLPTNRCTLSRQCLGR